MQAGAGAPKQENETRNWRSSPKQMFVRFFSAFLVFMCEHDALRCACWCVASSRACVGSVLHSLLCCFLLACGAVWQCSLGLCGQR